MESRFIYAAQAVQRNSSLIQRSTSRCWLIEGLSPLTLVAQLSQDNDHYEFRTIMRSNRFKALLLFLLIFGSFANAKIAIADELKQPNILFCFADDWGWPHAGAYGDPVVRTPAFDRLAREGVLFTNTFISSPSCTPSRNAVLTGQQFFRLAEGANLYGALDVQQPTFVRLLQKAGYQTGHWRKAWGPGNFTQWVRFASLRRVTEFH